MSGSRETANASKDEEGNTPTLDQGEEFKETNTGNRRGNQINRRTELVQLHIANRDFKDNTPEVRAVLGLLSKKLDIGTDFDKFREKLKGYVERKFENEKYVLCVVIEMEDQIKTFEENNMPEDLDEEEAKCTLKKKILELALTRYINGEEKIKLNMNKIYGILFRQCTPSLQSVMKGVPDHENKSKNFNCSWII